MCKVIMSIKPEYAEKIINGTKTFEFRKRKCKENIDSIIIYCTAPRKAIIAEVEVINSFVGSPSQIWKKTNKTAGINKEKFFNYYINSNEAVAYQLGRVDVFNPVKTLKEFGIKQPPQSYIYLD